MYTCTWNSHQHGVIIISISTNVETSFKIFSSSYFGIKLLLPVAALLCDRASELSPPISWELCICQSAPHPHLLAPASGSHYSALYFWELRLFTFQIRVKSSDLTSLCLDCFTYIMSRSAHAATNHKTTFFLWIDNIHYALLNFHYLHWWACRRSHNLANVTSASVKVQKCTISTALDMPSSGTEVQSIPPDHPPLLGRPCLLHIEFWVALRRFFFLFLILYQPSFGISKSLRVSLAPWLSFIIFL